MAPWRVFGGLLWMLLGVSAAGASEMEGRLRARLFQSYSAAVLPRRRVAQKVPVKLGMSLTQLISLNEKVEELTTKVYLDQEWIDYRLMWNPAEFEGVTSLRVGAEEVWLPDIVLMNKGEDDALHLRPPHPHRLLAAAGQEGAGDVPGSAHHHQIPDVHHDLGHLLRHPQRRGPERSPPLAEFLQDALLGQVFIHRLPRYLCLRRPKPEPPLQAPHPPLKETPVKRSHYTNEYFIRSPVCDFSKPNRFQLGAFSTDLRRFTEGPSHGLALPPDLKAATDAVLYMAQQLQEQEDYDALKEDWEFVAFVVDRLFFWMFIVITTVGTLTIFMDASLHLPPEKPFP